MKINWNKQYTTVAVYAFMVLAAVVLLIAALLNYPALIADLSRLTGIIMPFIYGFVIAYLISPILNTIEKKILKPLFKGKVNSGFIRFLAMVLSYLLSVVLIAVFISIVIPQIAVSLSNLALKVPTYIKDIEIGVTKLIDDNQWVFSNEIYKMVTERFNQDSLKGTFNEILNNAGNYIQSMLGVLLRSTTRITSGLVNLVIGIIISVYMLTQKERFIAQVKKFMYGLFPGVYVDRVLGVAHKSNRIFTGFIMGKILDSVIIGLLCFIGTTIMRTPYAVLISVVVGVTNVIPYFGPIIGAVPSVLIVAIDDWRKAIWFLIFVLILQQVDGNIIGPKILGDSTGLSAIWVVFAILVFGGTMGFIGMFIGVPVFAVIYGLTRDFIEARLRRKGMSSKTADYASKENPIEF